jgi:quercetin dioxygenase-like cupin family protein
MAAFRLDTRLVASKESTGGTFEIVEDTRKLGTGPIPHVHRTFQEAFYVLEGRFTFVRGHDDVDCPADSFVLIEPGTRHWYRAEEDRSRVLILAIPPNLAEFLDEMGKLLATGTSQADAMASLSDRYDTHPVP